jgi:hypothetical protein
MIVDLRRGDGATGRFVFSSPRRPVSPSPRRRSGIERVVA